MAIVSTDDGRMPFVEEGSRMPVVLERQKRLVDTVDISGWLKAWEIDVAIIEWVHAMPRQGVSSSFTLGRAAGAVEALAMVHAHRVEWVTPKRWKGHFSLSSDKQLSLDKAKRVFGRSFNWTKKADDGIAEAALMCQWFLDTRGK
jgi:crossover junction endodeoxyribonuclease RuvC